MSQEAHVRAQKILQIADSATSDRRVHDPWVRAGFTAFAELFYQKLKALLPTQVW